MDAPSNPRYERWRRRSFGITWLVYASYHLTRKSFGIAKVALGSDPSVSLSRSQLGLIDSTYLAVYSLGQFIFGPLVDRYRADLAKGIPDNPWPPVYPKMPDEAPRVAPSRARKPAE